MHATLPVRAAPPSDQARALRAMIQDRENSVGHPSAGRPPARTLAVISGKGGVGKSVIALNLAVSLAHLGQSVCLLDANPGLGNLDLMCGLNGYWNLSHVISGARQLHEVVLNGPEGVALVPGASSLAALHDCPVNFFDQLLAEFARLEQQYDVLIIDTGSGLHRLARQFAQACDELLLVTSPEPTSITDAYSTIKSLGAAAQQCSVLVNQVDTEVQAHQIAERLQHTAKLFLQVEIDALGGIPRDPAIPQSLLQRKPVATYMPSSPAARAFAQLAQRCRRTHTQPSNPMMFFSRLAKVMERAA